MSNEVSRVSVVSVVSMVSIVPTYIFCFLFSLTGLRGSCEVCSLALWDIRALVPRVFGICTERHQGPNWPWSLTMALQRHCRMQGFLQVGGHSSVSRSPRTSAAGTSSRTPSVRTSSRTTTTRSTSRSTWAEVFSRTTARSPSLSTLSVQLCGRKRLREDAGGGGRHDDHPPGVHIHWLCVQDPESWAWCSSLYTTGGGNTFLLILDFAIIFIVDCWPESETNCRFYKKFW